MAKKNMALIIGGQLIPKPTTFKKITKPNETDRETLGGERYTDFVNTTRSWQIGWKYLKEEDFAIINTLFYKQYENETYHVMQFDAYSIYAPVKLEISDENIKHNGSIIEGFSMIIKEKYAIS